MDRDHLGSTRLLTKLDQSGWEAMDFLPFGEQIEGNSKTTHKFAGLERDDEANNDYAMARYYRSRMGSFLTADPAGISATCLFDPQTQNRYLYVTNNPVNRTDRSGLCGDGNNSDCGGIGISLPIFPGGGSEQPAPPSPHPVFGVLFPLNFFQTQGSNESGLGPGACGYYDAKCKGVGDSYACKSGNCCRSFGDSPKANCVRECFIEKDQSTCGNESGSPQSTCRFDAHVTCYEKCGLFPVRELPKVYAACKDSIWGK